MRRRLFTFAAAVSLAVCAGLCVLWVPSYHGDPDRVGVSTAGGRYALKFERGRVVLVAPPPVRAWDDEAMERVASVRNDDVAWESRYSWGLVLFYPSASGTFRAEVVEGTGSDEVSRWATTPGRLDAAARALVLALDDPERFVAAHLLLRRLTALQGVGARRGVRDVLAELFPEPPWTRGEPAKARYEGLRLELRRPVRSTFEEGLHTSTWRGEPSVSVDPAQLPAVRDAWYDALGVRAGSVPFQSLAAGSLVLPAAWAASRLRRAWRAWRGARLRRRGLCSECGYDLRATRDCCPECGARFANHRAVTCDRKEPT